MMLQVMIWSNLWSKCLEIVRDIPDGGDYDHRVVHKPFHFENLLIEIDIKMMIII